MVIVVWYFVILNIFYKDCDSKLSTDIHVSCNGVDNSFCGDRHNKCKTIDHAIRTTVNSSSTTIILESAVNRSIVYPTSIISFPIRNGMLIRFQKDNPLNSNPRITTDPVASIPLLHAVLDSNHFEVQIDSVDFDNIWLLKAINSSGDGKVYIHITHSHLRLHQDTLFIEVVNVENVIVIIKDCFLETASRIAVGHKTKQIWLKYSSFKSTNKESSFRSLLIANSTITGGQFLFENYNHVVIGNTRVTQMQQRQPLFEFKNSKILIDGCSFTNNNIDSVNSHLIRAWQGSNIKISTSLFTNNRFWILISADESVVSLVNTTISSSMFKYYMLHGRNNSMLDLRSCAIENNKVSVFMLRARGRSAIRLFDTKFTNNTITKAIENNAGVQLSIRSCTISNNTLKRFIGSNGPAHILDSHFIGNTVNSGVHSDSLILVRGPTMDITNSSFISNTVKTLLSVYSTAITVSVNMCLFADNTAVTLMRVRPVFKNTIRTVEPYLELIDVTIKENTIHRSLISNVFAHITARKLVFTNNNVSDELIRLKETSAFLDDLVLDSNVFKSCITGYKNTRAYLSNVTAKHNVANGLGKFAYFADSTLNLENIWSQFKDEDGRNDERPVINVYKSLLDSKNTTLIIPQSLRLSSQPVLLWTFQRSSDPFSPIIHVKCPNNYNPKSETALSQDLLEYKLSCDSCEKGTYSTSAGSEFIFSTTSRVVYEQGDWAVQSVLKSKVSGFNTTRRSIECHSCPSGGICNRNIRSRGNFYGFKQINTTTSTIEFLPCPEKYCCSDETNQCTSIHTCNNQREGRLCGRCRPGYFVSYFTNDCFLAEKCEPDGQALFWALFTLTSVLTSLLLVFGHDLKELLKNLYTKVKTLIYTFICPQQSGEQHTRETTLELDTISLGKDSTTNSIISSKSTSSKAETPSCYSGIFNVIVSFYQIKSLITIEGAQNVTFLDKIFNIEIITTETESICPTNTSKNVILRELLKGYVSPCLMLFTVIICLAINVACCRCCFRKCAASRRKGRNISERFYVGYYLVMAFCYKNICRTAFSLANCIPTDSDSASFLYISGEIDCYTGWQIANIAGLLLWIVPFPLAVALAYNLAKSKMITLRTFMVFLMVPVCAPPYYIYQKFIKGVQGRHPCQISMTRLQEIFEDPYKEQFVWWESWRLYEKFIVTGISIFMINPVAKIFYIAPVLLLFLYLHFNIKPYKDSLFTLYRLDIVSYFCLCAHLVLNSVRAIVYIYDLASFNLLGTVLTIANYFEQICSPLIYLVIEVVITKIYSKLKKE